VIALAVVGPIASGKSTVLGLLGGLGAETCSADDFARELTRAGQPELKRIFAEFGAGYRREDGSLDRAALAALIFRSAPARERLEAILHPAILARIGAWLAERRAQSTPPPVAAVEVLRLPKHLRAREVFDAVWLCSASEETRLRRLVGRDGLRQSEARLRLGVQREQHVEDCEPDLILSTEGALADLSSRVERAWAELLQSGRCGAGPSSPGAP
jgi:dephospho-CoA kinase